MRFENRQTSPLAGDNVDRLMEAFNMLGCDGNNGDSSGRVICRAHLQWFSD
jgi:hypothetical protein